MQVDIILIISSRTPGRTKKAWYKYIMVCNGRTISGNGELKDTTGHRLVLTCAVEALKRMTRPSMITIHTNCRYLVNSHAHLQSWKDAGWKRPAGEVKNADLWQQFYHLQKGHAIRWRYEDTDLYR